MAVQGLEAAHREHTWTLSGHEGAAHGVGLRVRPAPVCVLGQTPPTPRQALLHEPAGE